MFSSASKRIIYPLQGISLIAMAIHMTYLFNDTSFIKVYSKIVPVLINSLILYILSLRIPKDSIKDKKIIYLSILTFIFYGIGDYVLVYPVAFGSAIKFAIGAFFFLVGHYMYFYVNYRISNIHYGGFAALFKRFPERKIRARIFGSISAFFVSLMVVVPNSAGRALSAFGSIYLTILAVTVFYGYVTRENMARSRLTIFGAVCFQVSDTVLSTNDFMFTKPWFRPFYMATYWMATSFYFVSLASYFEDLIQNRIKEADKEKKEK